jgi:TonB family protein
MNAYLNYVLEANFTLIVVLVCYRLLLAPETNFRLIRVFLLIGIFASLVFPLIHIGTSAASSPFSIGTVIPSYWLPEIVVGDGVAPIADSGPREVWTYAWAAYFAGSSVVALVIFIQLLQLIRIIHRSETYRLRQLRIAESAEDRSTFSFFNFIFIGNAHALSSSEKQQIIRHESVHASQWHSFDILMMNVLRIIFWFNPFITSYKKIFIQLHEFEADARTVENSDVNKYCSLLAKVALQSADLNLASHFNQSLTVKRIEMIRTIKSQIRRWKLAVVFAVLPLIFFFVACHDQVSDDIVDITKNSSHALIVPDFVQQRLTQLEHQHPDRKYVVLQLNEVATDKMEKLRASYGLPGSIEVFKASDGKIAAAGRGADAEDLLIKRNAALSATGNSETFAIVEFNDEASQVANAAGDDNYFTMVDEHPEFPGGFNSMMQFIRQNLRYPLSARQQGIEGTVYVAFIVEKDGRVSNVSIVRGISADADAEAARVVQQSPPWVPGKLNHQPVRVKFVLPIKFSLNLNTTKKQPGAIQELPAK